MRNQSTPSFPATSPLSSAILIQSSTIVTSFQCYQVPSLSLSSSLLMQLRKPRKLGTLEAGPSSISISLCKFDQLSL
ncbi:hypothetical protein M8C21_007819 [Ambrosia artemisiifolia]|uniref:Uncharacterized protein n=1 Tax=Ambrosia artemisiifolia TaxID=4212 RepID=A0AAD5CZ12_AMBAR|nr:hypothetical protein M8C21_007819 [Ambrosia artemisiifolia]